MTRDSLLFDQMTYQATPRDPFAIRYCLPLESVAAEPQKLLFVNLR